MGKKKTEVVKAVEEVAEDFKPVEAVSKKKLIENLAE